MSGEVKFRAYNFMSNEMMFSEKLTNDRVGYLLENHAHYCSGNNPDQRFSQVMLYTGVDDSEGNNIYKGDYISIKTIDGNNSVLVGLVVWDFDSWQIQDGGMLNSFKKMATRVIGNMYMNPELNTTPVLSQ